MGSWFRLAGALCLAWSFTACGMFPVWSVGFQTIDSLPRSPVPTSDAGSVALDSGERSGGFVAVKGFAGVLTAMPPVLFGTSILRLSQNEDGSIAVLSDDRSVSLLQGLDPALVNPAILPFLFPSCDIPDPTPVVAH